MKLAIISLASKAINLNSGKILDWFHRKYPMQVTVQCISVRAAIYGNLEILQRYKPRYEQPTKEELIGAVRYGHIHMMDYFDTICELRRIFSNCSCWN